ncbi:Sulfoquinovosyl transferase sqd2 [Orobanche minor]
MLTSSLSTPPFSLSTPSCSYSCNYHPTFFVSKVYCFGTSRLGKPISVICEKTRTLCPKRSKRSKSLNSLKIRSTTQNSILTSSNSSKMTIAEYREEEGPLLESQMNPGPRRIALFIEPSPFSYVSGYKNRFQNFIKYLREMGDEVMVITTDEGVPQEFYGALLIGSRRRIKPSDEYLDLMKECLGSFPCPYYGKVPLSLAFSPRIVSAVAKFKPHIIHASSPGIMVFGALAIAKLLSIPIVMSYHTHIPVYIPRYTFSWLVKPMWLILKFLHRAADLTLVPSAAIGRDLEAAEVTSANKIRLWNKGVDSESFHPRFFSEEMRVRLSNGESNKPLIVHVGRLGVEKSLDFLKGVMDREELEQMFSGMPAVFTGTLQGDELSQAYASGDVFIMPSESETLGLVVLEAMSSGLPVVAARAGGIPDIIPNDQQGKTGYLFNPGDHDDCLSKLEPLLYDLELRENIGKAARAEMEKYDWRAATREIRNQQYSDAIRFWREGRDELLRPFRLLFQR